MLAKYYTPRNRTILEPSLSVLKVAVITDTHLRFGVDGNPSAPLAIGGNRHHYASNSKLRNFIDNVSEGDYDVVVHGGDACDTPEDWDFFLDYWSRIEQPRIFCVGNHDLDDYSYPDLLVKMGYDERPEIGGSKFNETFVINNTRVIVLDCQYDVNDPENHTSHYVSRASEVGITWLIETLTECEEENALIFSHNIPHYKDHGGYFPAVIASTISTKLHTAINKNQKLKKVSWFGGHAHTSTPIIYRNLGACIGYRLPDSIEFWNGTNSSVQGMSEITLYSKGEIEITSKALVYPYYT